MFFGFRAIRPGERRDTWCAFLTLFFVVGSHSVLETAKDALFLSSISAARLPWMYVAIAFVSLALTQLQGRFQRRLEPSKSLSFWILVTSLSTGTFWVFLGPGQAWGLYILYVFTGVATSLVLIQFWVFLGNMYSVTQAKRLYSFVGTGSVLGAIIGSAVAGVLARVVDDRHLLLAAALGFFVAAVLPRFFGGQSASRPKKKGEGQDSSEGFGAAARFVLQHNYAKRLALLVLIAAVALTIGDYVFKATASAQVPASELGSFFASVYFVLNALSLFCQTVLVSFLLKRFDLVAAVSVLPALLSLSALGFVGLGSMASVLVIKGAEGSLKHSLHRTATELLFVPLSAQARARIKTFVDVACQRAGQTVASIFVLTAVSLGAGPIFFGLVLALVSLLWLGATVEIRRHYVDLFRRHLRRGLGFEDFPELDVASLETLVATLDSDNESEVVAALDVLDREGKARLVPGLILYHPSEAVVVRALRLFTKTQRTQVRKAAQRLLEHSSSEIRRAAVGAYSILGGAEQTLRLRLSIEESEEVRTAIMVNLIASEAIVGQDAREAVDAIVRHGAPAAKCALARAIAERRALGFEEPLIRLLKTEDRDVQHEVIRAMGRLKNRQFIEPLAWCLPQENVRAQVRANLVRFGEVGFEVLRGLFVDEKVSVALRVELPRVLCQSQDTEAAARTILEQLPQERNGFVRYRIIRTLEGLVHRVPQLQLDKKPLERGIQVTVERAYRYVDRFVALSLGAKEDPSRATEGHALLARSLYDKRNHAIDRLFRLLELRDPSEHFKDIYRGLTSKDPKTRANSMELVENVLKPPLRGAVVGLFDDLPDEKRLLAGAPYHRPLRLGYLALLEHMLNSRSRSVQDLTLYHIGELRLVRFRARIEQMAKDAQPSLDLKRTLGILGEDAQVEFGG